MKVDSYIQGYSRAERRGLIWEKDKANLRRSVSFSRIPIALKRFLQIWKMISVFVASRQIGANVPSDFIIVIFESSIQNYFFSLSFFNYFYLPEFFPARTRFAHPISPLLNTHLRNGRTKTFYIYRNNSFCTSNDDHTFLSSIIEILVTISHSYIIRS